MGAPGPDRGKGGKYFLILPEYDGEIPEGYFSLRSLQVTYSGLFFAVLGGWKARRARPVRALVRHEANH